MEGVIYALMNPDTYEVRYVGQSINVNRRYKDHLACKNKYNIHLNNWILKLKREGKEPYLSILEYVECKNINEREIYWINHFNSKGNRLCNILAGGGQKRTLMKNTIGKLTQEEIDSAFNERIAITNSLGLLSQVFQNADAVAKYYDISPEDVVEICFNKLTKVTLKGVYFRFYKDLEKLDIKDRFPRIMKLRKGTRKRK